MVLRLAILKATASAISAGNYRLDALDLQIEIANSNP
jgi:hypothetical protein